MRSVGTHPHKLDHIVIELCPGAGTVGVFLETDPKHIRVSSDRSSSSSRSIPGFNRSPMLMEPAAQLYDFICPIDLAHIVESAT